MTEPSKPEPPSHVSFGLDGALLLLAVSFLFGAAPAAPTTGVPAATDDVVVLLNSDLSALDRLDPTGLTIHWGANLGTPGQTLASGPLAEALPRIGALRERVRREQGWVLDLYLLRRRP